MLTTSWNGFRLPPRKGRDPAALESQDKAPLQPCAVLYTQPGREVLRPYQAFRRVSTRYDKLAESYLVSASLACAFRSACHHIHCLRNLSVFILFKCRLPRRTEHHAGFSLPYPT